MIRFKIIKSDDSFVFQDAEGMSAECAFHFSRKAFHENCKLKQIDIYNDTKLIASIYG